MHDRPNVEEQHLAMKKITLSEVRNLGWREFERFVGDVLRLRGFRIKHTSKMSAGGRPKADGGIDLIARRKNITFLVQCKQHNGYIGVKIIRELLGVLTKEEKVMQKALKSKGKASPEVMVGMVVCSSFYSTDAREFARDSGMTLIEGERLVKLAHGFDFTDANSPFLCPRCGSEMEYRKTKQVKYIKKYGGKGFYGCSQYSKTRCRGKRDLDFDPID